MIKLGAAVPARVRTWTGLDIATASSSHAAIVSRKPDMEPEKGTDYSRSLRGRCQVP